MRIQITLTSSESKRLIAKGVKALPCIQNALLHHNIVLAGGTTNGFLLKNCWEKPLKRRVPTLLV